METVVVTLQEAAGLTPQNPCPEGVFTDNESKVSLALQETFRNLPGSKSITTRRFTCKWQDETPGVTELLNGACSSVPQR